MTNTTPTVDDLHDALARFGVATLIALLFDDARDTEFASTVAEIANVHLAGRTEGDGDPRTLRILAQRYGINPADHGDDRPLLTFTNDTTPDQRAALQRARDELHDTQRADRDDNCDTADVIEAHQAYIEALATYAGIHETP